MIGTEEHKIHKLVCLVKDGTARWYNSLTSFPISYTQELVVKEDSSHSGLYYCYGYNKSMALYTLSEIKIRIHSMCSVDRKLMAFINYENFFLI